MQTICLVIQTGIQFRANRVQTDAKPDLESETPVSTTAVYVRCDIIGALVLHSDFEQACSSSVQPEP